MDTRTLIASGTGVAGASAGQTNLGSSNPDIDSRDRASRKIATALWVIAIVVIVGLISFYSMKHSPGNAPTSAPAGSSTSELNTTNGASSAGPATTTGSTTTH